MSNPSLPPGIEGEIQGALTIAITEVSWVSIPYDVIFRVRFWGEETAGILLPSSTIYLIYDIRTTLALLIHYLLDMGSLIIEVLNPENHIIGYIKVHLGSLKKAIAQSSLNFRGKFPIILKNSCKIGFASIAIKCKMNRGDEEVLESFKLNEIKAKKAIEDKKEQQTDLKAPKNNTKKIFVPRSSLNKIPKPNPPQGVKNIEKKKDMERRKTPTFKHTDDEEQTDKNHIKSFDEKNITQKDDKEKLEEKSLKNKKSGNTSARESQEPGIYKLDDKEIDPILWESSIKIKVLSYVGFGYQGNNVVLEIILYVPINENKSQEIMDSYTISSIEKNGNEFCFFHKTLHQLRLLGMEDGRVFEYKVVFVIKDENAQLLGSCEILWRDMISTMSIKNIITLQAYKGNDEVGEFKIKTTLKKPVIKTEEPMQYLNIIYFYIERIERLSCTGNIFVCYKSLVDMEKITTQVFWNYSGETIGHELLIPYVQSVKDKIAQNLWPIEVWEKVQERETLLGIAKIPLNCICPPFIGSVYPSVAVDEYLPIVNPFKGSEVGYIKICLAIGTSLQIQRLSNSQKKIPDGNASRILTKTTGKVKISNSGVDNFRELFMQSPGKSEISAKTFAQDTKNWPEITFIKNSDIK
ncbi:hypothetical protein SteCoe_11753 [Stentor coeruleus]|uniref:C2CD3 N-terminal C2 domain-containing protein n=1 Tax=Stentor coeruleus TaxID=5963 RepID=A0A1R2CCD6_9CILI|nr:hypothetical protein SteCoe_11753 [Stentor coeruleus]